MARLESSVRTRGRTRSRAILANRPSLCLVTAGCTAQRETVLLEVQQRVVAEHAADGASHHPFHALKEGGHVVAPVADAGPTPACHPWSPCRSRRRRTRHRTSLQTV